VDVRLACVDERVQVAAVLDVTTFATLKKLHGSVVCVPARQQGRGM
jgi:hypothetical protein